jgi:hypothetical protein
MTAAAAGLPAITHPGATPTIPQRVRQGMHQGINSPQGMIATPTAIRIAVIITPIPKLIRNIRHHNPQANFQVGLTSLSICFSSFLRFFQAPSLSID